MIICLLKLQTVINAWKLPVLVSENKKWRKKDLLRSLMFPWCCWRLSSWRFLSLRTWHLSSGSRLAVLESACVMDSIHPVKKWYTYVPIPKLLLHERPFIYSQEFLYMHLSCISSKSRGTGPFGCLWDDSGAWRIMEILWCWVELWRQAVVLHCWHVDKEKDGSFL